MPVFVCHQFHVTISKIVMTYIINGFDLYSLNLDIINDLYNNYFIYFYIYNALEVCYVSLPHSISIQHTVTVLCIVHLLNCLNLLIDTIHHVRYTILTPVRKHILMCWESSMVQTLP